MFDITSPIDDSLVSTMGDVFAQYNFPFPSSRICARAASGTESANLAELNTSTAEMDPSYAVSELLAMRRLCHETLHPPPSFSFKLQPLQRKDFVRRWGHAPKDDLNLASSSARSFASSSLSISNFKHLGSSSWSHGTGFVQYMLQTASGIELQCKIDRYQSCGFGLYASHFY